MREDTSIVKYVLLPIIICLIFISTFSVYRLQQITLELAKLNSYYETLQIELIKYQTYVNNHYIELERRIDKQQKIIDEYQKYIDKMSRLIGRINKNVSYEERKAIAENIVRVSVKYNVPIEYLFAIAWVESTFNPKAYNKRTGCIGLMQINPYVWLKNPELKSLLFDIPTNIEAGGYILRYYYNIYHSWDKAFIAYYGQSKYAYRIYRHKIFRKARYVRLVLKESNKN